MLPVNGIRVWVFLILFTAGLFLRSPVPGRTAAATGEVTDSLYNAHHPRILFTTSEIPALRAKISDGGHDDDAYAYLRFLAGQVYPYLSPHEILGNEYGLNSIPNLGLAAFLEFPQDTFCIARGREATLYLADNYSIDYDEAYSGLRLCGLALGYDMFFKDAPDSVRTYIRDEIVSYVQFMTNQLYYELFEYRPYLANHSAMFGGPLGMAAVCLEDEADPQLLADALDMADRIVGNLLAYQFDPEGAYKEGCLYGGWTLRQLVFYFHARKRYDGFDYSNNQTIRNIERWFAHELLPEGRGKTNNLNDSPYYSTPLARNTTYLDWAQEEWNSGLSAWIWEHVAGAYGVDLQIAADKASTVLWSRNLPLVQPDSVLPRSCLWLDRGLYYFRTGWQSGMSSRDVVLSFYSGKFHGGHAQEDQNQFTLYGYGEKFAIDHGSHKQSESHNIVFIDGAGQHNAGGSIGTDGRISEHVLSDFADYMLGDATDAYTTHSEFNDPDVPIPGSDWSWGYSGANPVRHAHRRLFAVHDGETPPFFVIADDIDKDGAIHNYQWRLHTLVSNTVSTAANPIRIDGQTGWLDLHVLYPDYAALNVWTSSYNNNNPDPDATLLKLSVDDVNPRFAFLMFPADTTVSPPQVTREVLPWGFACRLDWGNGLADLLIGNHPGGLINYGADSIKTDAAFALLRLRDSCLVRHLLTGVSVLFYGGTEYARFFNGRVNCALAGNVVELDCGNAHFRLLDTGIDRIEYRSSQIPFVRAGGYLLPGTAMHTDAVFTPRNGLSVSVHPNPFNPSTTVFIEVGSRTKVTAEVFDPVGRRVKLLMRRALSAGRHAVVWDGTNRHGRPVSSGVYFLKVSGGGRTCAKKLTIVK